MIRDHTKAYFITNNGLIRVDFFFMKIMGLHDYYILLLYNTNDIYFMNVYVVNLNYGRYVKCIIWNMCY